MLPFLTGLLSGFLLGSSIHEGRWPLAASGQLKVPLHPKTILRHSLPTHLATIWSSGNLQCQPIPRQQPSLAPFPVPLVSPSSSSRFADRVGPHLQRLQFSQAPALWVSHNAGEATSPSTEAFSQALGSEGTQGTGAWQQLSAKKHLLSFSLLWLFDICGLAEELGIVRRILYSSCKFCICGICLTLTWESWHLLYLCLRQEESYSNIPLHIL